MYRIVRMTVLALIASLVIGIGQPSFAQTNSSQTTQTQQGNPSTKVWVNTHSGVYHCPGTRYYGNTKNGTYMTQAEAQKAGNRPAYGKVCR